MTLLLRYLRTFVGWCVALALTVFVLANINECTEADRYHAEKSRQIKQKRCTYAGMQQLVIKEAVDDNSYLELRGPKSEVYHCKDGDVITRKLRKYDNAN